MRIWKAGGLVLAATLASGAARGDAPPQVDLSLVLLVDVSGSVSGPELDLQRAGYVAAFRHPDLAEAIAMGPRQAIAVTYVEWAGPDHQVVVIPCTTLASRQDALAVSQTLAAGATTGGQGTSISSALLFAARLVETCPGSARAVIDVSGNGPNNIGPDILAARDAVLATGATINGLPVLMQVEGASVRPVRSRWLAAYYDACVAGGPGAFVLPIDDPSLLRAAILRKLVTEIALGRERLFHARQERRMSVDCHLIGQTPGR